MHCDVEAFQKIKSFLLVYSPFKYVDSVRLISLSSGVVAGVDDGVNCDQAEEVGYELLKTWDNMSFADVSLKKADQVKTMAGLSNSVSIGTDKVNIDPHTLFHRLILAGERFGRLQECFAYELTPYPLSLFKAGIMQKPDKPSLYRDFAKGMTNALKPANLTYVIDGGYMLQKVHWFPAMNVSGVLTLFCNYVKAFGVATTVVFDGYSTGPTVKNQDQLKQDR